MLATIFFASINPSLLNSLFYRMPQIFFVFQ